MTKKHKALMRAYSALLMLSVALMFLADNMSPGSRALVLPSSVDAFKTIIGANIGFLSALWGGK